MESVILPEVLELLKEEHQLQEQKDFEVRTKFWPWDGLDELERDELQIKIRSALRGVTLVDWVEIGGDKEPEDEEKYDNILYLRKGRASRKNKRNVLKGIREELDSCDEVQNIKKRK
ncbi:hypothetical protein LAU_0096 [Lausannevirus]|uniref:Uncharacterized protein n=1 Tax=Lausannevirus TaxID=999883 RepID=F2WL26_9VIRU|nr:hypothetical protein LAU_0096 [Lausannevirus]AEA06949.1 hypothetical protein LAU_0096 [Lausannevirus]